MKRGTLHLPQVKGKLRPIKGGPWIRTTGEVGNVGFHWPGGGRRRKVLEEEESTSRCNQGGRFSLLRR